MGIMRKIGQQIGQQQKVAIRLPGMPAPRGGSMGAMTLKMPPRGAPRGAGLSTPPPTPAPRQMTAGGAASQGLADMLKTPGVRNAAGSIGRAAKAGIPGGILLNRLIATLAAQNQTEGAATGAIGSR